MSRRFIHPWLGTLPGGLSAWISLSPVFYVLQSAAMEETVIWEQHTVTLHRVGRATLVVCVDRMFCSLTAGEDFTLSPLCDLCRLAGAGTRVRLWDSHIGRSRQPSLSERRDVHRHLGRAERRPRRRPAAVRLPPPLSACLFSLFTGIEFRCRETPA